MANIFRGPLYVGRREFPPVLSLTAIVVQSLLTSTLAVAVPAAPPGAHWGTPLVDASARLRINADTSLRRPLTLTGGGTTPFFVSPHFAPAPHRPLEWLNASTAAGTPKTLYADKNLPVFNPAWVPPNAEPVAGWRPANTSAGTPTGLKTVIVPPPQGTVAPFLGPQRFWWQPPNSSAGTPKPLIADAQLPVRNPPIPLVADWRAVTDTSHGTPVELFPVVAAALPPGEVAWVSVPTYPWKTADTSTGTPKGLIRDAQLPFFNPIYNAPGLVRSVVDTSHSTPAELFPVVATPLPPGAAAWVGAPTRWWQPADSSRGVAKTLTADAQAPISNPPQLMPDRIRPVVDTSQSSYGTTHIAVIVPLPPGDATPLFLPQWTWLNANTTFQTNFVLPAVLPPAPIGPAPDVSKTLYNPHERLGTETAVEGDERLGTATATGGDARLGNNPPPPRKKRLG